MSRFGQTPKQHLLPVGVRRLSQLVLWTTGENDSDQWKKGKKRSPGLTHSPLSTASTSLSMASRIIRGQIKNWAHLRGWRTDGIQWGAEQPRQRERTQGRQEQSDADRCVSQTTEWSVKSTSHASRLPWPIRLCYCCWQTCLIKIIWYPLRQENHSHTSKKASVYHDVLSNQHHRWERNNCWATRECR